MSRDRESQAGQQRAESAGGVLGVGIGLAVLLAAAVALLIPPTRPLDGGAELAARFSVAGQTPLGFAVTDARRLALGEVMVVLSEPGGPPPDPPLAPLADGERSPPPVRQGPRGKLFSDWSKVPEGKAGTPPVEAAFVWYSRKRGEGVLERQFAEVRFRDLKHVEGEETEAPVDSGHLDWGPYEAPYVRVRNFRREHGRAVFHDTLRVNLSIGKVPCVLYLRWPRGLPGSVEWAEKVLAVYRPRE